MSVIKKIIFKFTMKEAGNRWCKLDVYTYFCLSAYKTFVRIGIGFCFLNATSTDVILVCCLLVCIRQPL